MPQSQGQYLYYETIKKTKRLFRSCKVTQVRYKLFKFSSCSNFTERPTLEEMEKDKPVLPEREHLRSKVTDEQLEAIKDVLGRNEYVFSRHKADIGCCNFVEHEIELEESAVPHREGARRMIPLKTECT